MLWEGKAVSRASLSVWLLTGTISSSPLWPISFHLFLTFLFSPRSLLLAFPNQYFCLKKLNPLKQTSLMSPGLPGAKLTSRTQAAVAGLKNKLKMKTLLRSNSTTALNLWEDSYLSISSQALIPLLVSPPAWILSLIFKLLTHLQPLLFFVYLPPFIHMLIWEDLSSSSFGQ